MKPLRSNWMQVQVAMEREASTLSSRAAQLQQAGVPDDDPAWQQLRHDVAELQTRYKEFESLQAEAQQQEVAQHQERLREWAASENAAAIREIPSWQDPVKRNAEIAAMKDALRNQYKFSDQEITSVIDHRMVKVIRDAVAYRRLKSQRAGYQSRPVKAVSPPQAAGLDFHADGQGTHRPAR